MVIYRMLYADIVARRRALSIPGFTTLAEVGFDGDWVTPYQISSRSPQGPVLVAYNWLDAPSVRANAPVLSRLGYLPHIPFNAVLDLALSQAGMTRADVYMTQAFHLLPSTRSGSIPAAAVNISFDQVTRYELEGRRVIALGRVAATACRRHGVLAVEVPHPSARGLVYAARAREIAAALVAGS